MRQKEERNAEPSACVTDAQSAKTSTGVRKVRADGGYHRHLAEHAATLGTDMEITTRTPGTRDFTQIPKRRAIERTYRRLLLHRVGVDQVGEPRWAAIKSQGRQGKDA